LNKWNPFSISSESQVSSSKFAIFSASPYFLSAAASLLTVLFALIVFHPFSSPPIDGRLHIDFLDVGQGDSALIRFPNGKLCSLTAAEKRISIK
jgi:beta-lactamase superfamily II metal-dependent hydrolase